MEPKKGKAISILSVLAIAGFVFVGGEVWARGGSGRAVQKDALCNNPKMTGSRRTGCQAILSQLTDANSCTKPILDRIAAAAARGKLGGISAFCPNYSQFNGDSHTRALIWRNIIAALIKEESSWDPTESGDGGRSRGLLQIGYSNTTMRPYACACRGARQNIENAAANARCGSHIYLYNVARDMNMGGGPAGRRGSYGAARFFGPYGDAQAHKRRRMASKVAEYCRSLPAPSRPRTPAPAAPAIAERRPLVQTPPQAVNNRPAVVVPVVVPQYEAKPIRESGFMFSF